MISWKYQLDKNFEKVFRLTFTNRCKNNIFMRKKN